MKCEDFLLEKFGKEFSKKDIEQILDHARSIIKKNKGVEDFNKLMDYVVKERIAYLESKDRYLKQIEKLIKNEGRIDEMFSIDKVDESSAKDILESFLSRNGKYQQVSLESLINSKYNEYAQLISTLENMPEFAILRDGDASPEMQKAVIKELYNLSMTEKVSGNSTPEVRKIAETIHAVNKKRLSDLQSVGFGIQDLKGYMYSGAYDPNLVRGIGIEKFNNLLMNAIDVDGTARKWGIDLDSPEGSDEFAKLISDIYETISTKDASVIYKTGIEDVFAEIKTPTRFNHAVSRSRSFVFKDGESFHDFFIQMSGNNLLAAVHRDIRKTAKSYATAEIFGTSPIIAKEFLFKKVNTALIENGNKPLEASYKRRYDTLFGIVSGNASLGDSLSALTANNIKKTIDMALLGKAAFKALFSDPVFSAAYQSTLSDTNFFTALIKSVHEFNSNVINPSYRKEMANRLNMVVSNLRMETLDDSMVGYGAFTKGLTKAHNFYMKMTGLNFQANNMRLANATMASQHLFDIFTKNIDRKIRDADLGVLKRYGFSDSELKIMSKLGLDKEYGMITPESIRGADIEKIKKVVESEKNVSFFVEDGTLQTRKEPKTDFELKKEIESTASKLAAYLNDIALLGSPNPTKAIQFMMSGMVDPSTPVGSLMSLVTMYKGFAASIYRVYRNIAWHDGVKDSNALVQYMFAGRGAIGYTMLSSIASGGASLLMTDILDGKTPRDPSRPEFLTEAFMAGGAGGLLADYFLENYEQGKKDIVRDLAGPAVGRLLPDIFEVKSGIHKALAEGDDKALTSTFINISRWIPAQNLWLTNAVFGNMVLNNYRAWADPKFESRRRKQMKQMSGQLWKQEQLIK